MQTKHYWDCCPEPRSGAKSLAQGVSPGFDFKGKTSREAAAELQPSAPLGLRHTRTPTPKPSACALVYFLTPLRGLGNKPYFRCLLLSCAAISIVLFATSLDAGAQWLNYPTAGIPRAPDGKPNLTGPAPRTGDGKPDFSGVWQPDDQKFFQNIAAGLKPEDVPIQPWAKDLQQLRVARDHVDDPLARCLPHGVPRINTNGLFPFKIIQTPQLVVMLYEQLYLFRQIFMDGRKLGNDAPSTWLGYSTAKWDADTLVVETSGFNDKTWLDTQQGHPATEALHVTERFRRPDFGHLEMQATIDDPKAYTKPWTSTTQKFHLVLNTDILEFICIEGEKDLPHLMTK